MSHSQLPDQGSATYDGDIFGFDNFPPNSQLDRRRTEPFIFDNSHENPPSHFQSYSMLHSQPLPHLQPEPAPHAHMNIQTQPHSHAPSHSHQPHHRGPYPKFPTSSSFEYSEPSLITLGTASTHDSKSFSGLDDMSESVGDESKRSKKLERNRESARLCRHRKKAYIHSLEEKVGQLSSRIQELQQEYWYTKEKLRDEQRKVAIALEGLVNGKDTEKDCAVLLARFSDICYKQGQSAILYHLEQIKDLLIPAQQLKFILWGLDQHDEFYDMGSKSSGGTIWSMLSEELGWTDEQRQRLVQYRDFIRAQNKELTTCIHNFDLLRDEICHRLDSLQRCVNEIRTLFTPQQQAKFVVWVEQNQPVMKMLNTVMTLPRERQEEQTRDQSHVNVAGSALPDGQSHCGNYHTSFLAPQNCLDPNTPHSKYQNSLPQQNHPPMSSSGKVNKAATTKDIHYFNREEIDAPFLQPPLKSANDFHRTSMDQ